MENLHSIADSISTGSTKPRILILKHEIPEILTRSEMSSEIALPLVDIIFKTLYIYNDKGSRKAVDGVIVTALSEVTFMKSFAAALVQCMEKQLKLQSHVGCYILLKWSCLLLTKSQFASLSKNALSRVAFIQASVLHIVMHIVTKFAVRSGTGTRYGITCPDIYRSYMEELKEARIPYKDAPEFIQTVLEFSISNPSFYDQWKEKRGTDLIEAFCPLFSYLVHEDFKSIVVPSSVKTLKRNPELVLESVGVLLKSTSLDLSKYAVEILSVVLLQARHADELRRLVALDIVRCLSQKSSNPDAAESMFHAIKSVIGEERLVFPYQRVGMINAIKELSNSPEGKYLTSLSPTICTFLLSCYKEDGNEEVKFASLSALGYWAARSADAVQPDLLSLATSGLKEKETLRRGHLRCLRVMSKKASSDLFQSSLQTSAEDTTVDYTDNLQ
ncbi:eIF-2-alpha kinase activator GCN1 [Orobanche hederae]